ncbi:MAG: NAD(P)/FAD-dependent oxidoreductase [Candidatus Rokubacteria bacterium]|nr:NAD(P)/FAD-dependent oxidoreductase [Candidatus Rokubacteria bacterium]
MSAASRRDADVVVVGAGPAGAATAILFAEQGLETVVVDRARFPRPKICGEYLSPEAARILDRLGVLKHVDAVAAPLRGMRITTPDGRTIAGTYGAVGAWRPYRQHAMAVPRLTLDALLAERLRALPLEFRDETRVTDLVDDGDRVAGVIASGPDGASRTVRARLVVAADGRSSIVGQRLGLRGAHRLRRMALVTYVTGIAGCAEWGEIFVDPPDYAILNPVALGRVNLSVVVPLDDAVPYSDRLEQFLAARVKHLPHLARRLQGATRVEPVRAMGPLAYDVASPRRPGVLLVGDAAGFYDPFTGEGVFAALRGAELLVEVAGADLRRGEVTLGTLASYERRRREAFGAKVHVTRLLQAVIRRRWLANAVGRVLARRPDLLEVVMGVLGDFVPPRALLRALLRR